jgi:hypothetical protein
LGKSHHKPKNTVKKNNKPQHDAKLHSAAKLWNEDPRHHESSKTDEEDGGGISEYPLDTRWRGHNRFHDGHGPSASRMNMEWRNGGGEEGRRMVLPFFHSSTLPLVFSK